MQIGTKKNVLRIVWDFIGIPFRMALFDQEWLPRFHWTTLEQERMNAVLPFIQGRVLDIGAGPNTLVKLYGNGIGVDVVDWGGGALVVDNTARLPFPDADFDSVTMIACLNHIPNRSEVLKEARRILRPGGRLIVTMIGPVLGEIGHRIWWYSEDKKRGGMRPGEIGGMTPSDVIALCGNTGFVLSRRQRFLYGMNNVYVFNAANETKQTAVEE